MALIAAFRRRKELGSRQRPPQPLLAACRTGVDFYVPAILLQIERLSLLKIIAAIADDRWRKVSGYQAAIQASIESVEIHDGIVSGAGSGRVSKSGAVSVSVSSGGSYASGSGRLSTSSGGGSWHGVGSRGACSGTWVAGRR
jgi:hypothetical protein